MTSQTYADCVDRCVLDRLGGVDLLVQELCTFFVTFALHSRQEDEVMFPALRR